MARGTRWGRSQYEPLIHILRKLDLTTAAGLHVCLDAGDPTSAPAGAVTWVNRFGATDFDLGLTNAADAEDPTQRGTAGGLSKNEHFYLDGGDFFRASGGNSVPINSLHKNNAAFTIAGWVITPRSSSSRFFAGTGGAGGGATGFYLGKTVNDKLQWRCINAGATAINIVTAASIPDTGNWFFFAVSLSESVGANGAILAINSTQELFTSTYTSPASANADWPMEIGAGGDSASPLLAGSEFAEFAIWTGAGSNLSAAQLTTLYEATRGRFGV